MYYFFFEFTITFRVRWVRAALCIVIFLHSQSDNCPLGWLGSIFAENPADDKDLGDFAVRLTCVF